MTILSDFWNAFTGFWQHVLSDMLSVSDFIWSFPILVLTVVVAVTLTIGTGFFRYHILACIMAIVGAVGGLSTIWGLADLGLGIANITNLCVLFGLRKDIFKITAEYKDMIKKGEV